MKKNNKLIFGVLSIAALAGGAYYFMKNILNKDSDDDFDDFEDDFDDFDVNDDKTDGTDEREYVTINITEDASTTTSEETEAVATTTEESEKTVEDVSPIETNETAEEVTTEE